MRDQIEREVERRQRGDGTAGKAARQPDAPRRRRVQIERQNVAAQPPCLVGGERKDEPRSLDFGPRIANRLARFVHDRLSELLRLRRDTVLDGAQNREPLRRRQPPRARERRVGGVDRHFGVCQVGECDFPNYSSVVGTVDRACRSARHPFPRQILSKLSLHRCLSKIFYPQAGGRPKQIAPKFAFL